MGTTKKVSGSPKRAARRADFDVPIGPWFDQLPPEKRAPLEELRRIVEATVPKAGPA